MKVYIILLWLAFGSNILVAQTDTVVSKVYHFSGSLSANTNGFSLVPTFSLGKPALQTGLNINATHSRFSFHPQIWYSLLDYKPWSLIFIWRYKAVVKDKFSFVVGTHAPAINFKSGSVIENGTTNDIVKARRFYPALELIPTYHITKSTSIGFYYLFGVGIEKEVSSVNNFLSLRADFNKITLSKDFFIRFQPQIYFLSIDQSKGIYAAGGLSVCRKGFPLNISSNFNTALKSSINADAFAWNVGVNYEFASQFVKR